MCAVTLCAALTQCELSVPHHGCPQILSPFQTHHVFLHQLTTVQNLVFVSFSTIRSTFPSPTAHRYSRCTSHSAPRQNLVMLWKIKTAPDSPVLGSAVRPFRGWHKVLIPCFLSQVGVHYTVMLQCCLKDTGRSSSPFGFSYYQRASVNVVPVPLHLLVRPVFDKIQSLGSTVRAPTDHSHLYASHQSTLSSV